MRSPAPLASERSSIAKPYASRSARSEFADALGRERAHAQQSLRESTNAPTSDRARDNRSADANSAAYVSDIDAQADPAASGPSSELPINPAGDDPAEVATDGVNNPPLDTTEACGITDRITAPPQASLLVAESTAAVAARPSMPSTTLVHPAVDAAVLHARAGMVMGEHAAVSSHVIATDDVEVDAPTTSKTVNVYPNPERAAEPTTKPTAPAVMHASREVAAQQTAQRIMNAMQETQANQHRQYEVVFDTPGEPAKQSHVMLNRSSLGGQVIGDGVQQPEAATRSPNASAPSLHAAVNREVRSLQHQIAAAIDATRSQAPNAIPAAARAASLEQALRIEQATGMHVQTSSEVQPRVNAAAMIGSGNSAHGEQFTSSSGFGARFTAVDEPHQQASFTAQAIRGLTAMLNQRGGSMMLRLDPPELGSLRVQMTITGGNVSALFTAASQQTQALLDRSLVTLRQSLESQGLTVERLSVGHTSAASSTGAQGSTARQDDSGASPQQHGGGQHHDAGGAESRGRREHQSDGQHAHWSSRARSITFESLLAGNDTLVGSSTGASA